MFTLQRDSRKKDQVVHIPLDPAAHELCDDESDALQDTIAALDWGTVHRYSRLSAIFDVNHRKVRNVKRKFDLMKRGMIADIALVKAYVEASLKKKSKM